MSESIFRSNCRVIVVDDEPFIVELLSTLLTQAHFDVRGAESGERCLQLLNEEPADVVLTDIRMHGMDGFELIRKVRKLDPVTRLVVMTAYDSYNMIQRSLVEGAWDYLAKPLSDHERVVATIERAAEVVRLQRANDELLLRLRKSNDSLAEANSRLLTLNRQLRILSITDSLTGLHNRRFIDRALEGECARRARNRLPLSVAMIDIDHFKAINDTYGHKSGDSVLTRVADVIRQCARNTDVIGRYGGEEFMVLLPETNPQSAMIFAERVRSSLENCRIELDGGTVNVTASVGVSGIGANSDDVAARTLVGQADQAMYSVKENGRNGIVLAIGTTTETDTNTQPLRPAA